MWPRDLGISKKIHVDCGTRIRIPVEIILKVLINGLPFYIIC